MIRPQHPPSSLDELEEYLTRPRTAKPTEEPQP